MHVPQIPPSRARRFVVIATALATVCLGLTTPGVAVAQTSTQAASSKASPKPNVAALCGVAKKGASQCFALRRIDLAGTKGVHPNLTPSGYGPSDLMSAYNLPAGGGAGQTVALVDAFDDPNAEADLTVYRSQYGLPPCTTANGCFSKIDQRGGTSYPAPDAGWAGEISLDLDMVSAIAPQAHILLVESDDNNNDNLGAAVDEAVALGAKYVSNSYGSQYDSTPGSGEDPSEVTDLDPYYNHPGVAVVASSGDDDYGVSYPAASQYVTAVGGTSLVADSSSSRLVGVGLEQLVRRSGQRLFAVRGEADLADRQRLREAHRNRRLRGRRPGDRRRRLRHVPARPAGRCTAAPARRHRSSRVRSPTPVRRSPARTRAATRTRPPAR